MQVQKIIISLSFLFCFFTSEGRQLSLRRLGSDEGLSQHTITCMAQSQQGFMWFGTKEGLNKFNSYHFEVYDFDITDSTTLANGDINTLFKDRQGRFWVGSGGGLSLYDSKYDCFKNYYEGLNTQITAITQESDSVLWIGTAIYGLYRFNISTKHFENFPNNLRVGKRASMNISTIHNSNDGRLWVGSEDGIWIFNIEKQAYEGLVPFMKGLPTEQKRINCFFSDSDGDWWIGTYGGGLHCLPKGQNKLKTFLHDAENDRSLSNNFIHAINEDRRGRIWVGTSNGLNFYNKQTEVFSTQKKSFNQINSLAANRILSLYKDTVGIMWVGTENGINFYDPKREKFQSKGNNAEDISLLGNNGIRAIYQDPSGYLWLGTNTGLTKLNDVMSNSQKFVIKDEDDISFGVMIEEPVTSILPKSFNELWLGTQSHGIARFNVNDGTFQLMKYGTAKGKGLSSNTINHLVKDAQNNIWVATEGGGLNCWPDGEDGFVVYKHDDDNPNSISSNFVSCVEPSKKDASVWVGTYGGGFSRFNPQTKTFTTYRNDINDSTSINSNLVNAILEDSRGDVWVGTQAGINRFDTKEEVFQSFNMGFSNTSYIIKAIEEDKKGNLWISTNKGLLCYFYEEEVFKIYDEKDGLQGNVFHERAVYQANNGNMFFGGFNGFSFFHPSGIQDNSYIPPVFINRLLIDNQPIRIKRSEMDNVPEPSIPQAIWATDYFELNYTNRVVSFEFTALNYRLPEKNRYRFKLEPFETEWVYKDADRREATYTNLAPNTYTFNLQASNNDGVWNEEGVQITFDIHPPLWKKWWMRAIIFTSIILTALGVYRMRVRRIKRTRDELERQVKLRTKQLNEKTHELEIKAEELETQKEEIMQINDQLESMNDQLETARQKSDEMLLNILPRETANELQEKGFYTPRNYQLASVLFTDFKSFTAIAESLSTTDLIKELDFFFQYFDKVMEKHGLEKIKTIGDAYMCAGGIPKPNRTNPIDVVLAGLEIAAFADRTNAERVAKGMLPWRVRIGINTGELVAGVVGRKKFAYDIWGDTVNLASRMESSGEVGRVNISENTYHYIKHLFVCHHRGKVFAKGKGDIDMYYVECIRPELSLDADGYSPNADFRIQIKKMMMKNPL